MSLVSSVRSAPAERIEGRRRADERGAYIERISDETVIVIFGQRRAGAQPVDGIDVLENEFVVLALAGVHAFEADAGAGAGGKVTGLDVHADRVVAVGFEREGGGGVPVHRLVPVGVDHQDVGAGTGIFIVAERCLRIFIGRILGINVEFVILVIVSVIGGVEIDDAADRSARSARSPSSWKARPAIRCPRR